MHRRRSLAVRLVPAVAVLLALAAVVRPALAADPKHTGPGDTARPASTEAAGSGRTPSPSAPFWTYRDICTEGVLTAGTVTAGTAGWTTSVSGWIRPCAGHTTDGARYGLVFSVDDVRRVQYRSYDSPTGTTEFQVQQAFDGTLSVDDVVSVCIVDHGWGDTAQQLVRLVACAGLKALADGTTQFVQVPVAHSTYRSIRSIHLRNRPGDDGLCPACV